MALTKPFLSDQQTLQGLKEHNNASYAVLYQFYYPAVERFILKNNGTTELAKDIFQETIIVLLEKLPYYDFQLSSSLKTYVFAISSNLWLKHLREAKKMFYAETADLDLQEFAQIQLPEEKESTLEETLKGILAKLTPKCQRLLNAIFLLKKAMKQILQENGYTTMHNAQNQKYKCLQQARNRAGHTQ